MGDRTIRWDSRSRLEVRALLALLALAASLSPGCAPRQGGWSFPRAETWRRSHVRAAGSTYALAPVPGARAAGPQVDPDFDPVARGLFVRNCATCHGEDGSGQGPSVLDRPARNFKDGGFSFGNTADAIFNTISHGIPGTPMPAFDPGLSERERRQLAAFVRTLGPPVEEVDVADTIMTVTEETGPLIVRGILPPIVEGAPLRPRGLLIGLPGDEGTGLTFEYRIDDVRLLGVRQGGFVERTDWNDRGGTPLKPLGGLIWVDAGGDPPATFSLEVNADDGSTRVEALTSALALSKHEQPELSYALRDSEARCVAGAVEGASPVRVGSLPGFWRSFLLQDMGIEEGRLLCMRVPVPADSQFVDSFTQLDRGAVIEWRVFRRADGVHECIGIFLGSFGHFESNLPLAVRESPRSLDVVLALTSKEALRERAVPAVRIDRVFTTEWTPTVRAEFGEIAP